MRTALALSLLVGVLGMASAQDVMVKVTVDGKSQSYNPAARMRGGTVYVPLRQGAQSLGVQVKWHADSQRAQVCTPTGCSFIRQSEGIMVNGSLFPPLRKMGEATGAKVFWDAPNKAVRITK
ncbi:copper amine oxidase N-terminal domain-containing protein [bacterium]|nr:copper amine oxidase N-terminal domain-containing protein [bacterium]